MDPHLRDVLESLTTAQHGVVTRQQLLAAGISRHAVQNATDSGRLRRVFAGIFVSGNAPLTALTRAQAALLHVGGDATLARLSALAARRLVEWPNVVQIVQTRHFRSDDPRIAVHRTRALPDEDVCVIDGMRATVASRSIVDAASDLRRIDLADVLARGMRRGVISRADIEQRLARRPNDPRSGALRDMIATRGAADSGVELVLARAIERRGVRVIVNGEVRTLGGYVRRGDIVLPDSAIVVQLDSDEFHTGERAAFDMRRDADWAAVGYLTLRVPPRRVRRELTVVVDEVLRAHLVRFQPPLTG